jgi:putative flippase GtrA
VNRKMIGKLIKKYKEIIMYLIFGVLTTLVNWFCYAFLTKSGMEMNISNCIAWLVAVLFAFITNKVFVFESKNMEMRFVCRELIKFVGARLATGAIEILGLPLLYYIGIADFSTVFSSQKTVVPINAIVSAVNMTFRFPLNILMIMIGCTPNILHTTAALISNVTSTRLK